MRKESSDDEALAEMIAEIKEKKVREESRTYGRVKQVTKKAIKLGVSDVPKARTPNTRGKSKDVLEEAMK